MRRLLNRLFSTLSAAIMLTVISSVFPFMAEASEQTFSINGNRYEFDKDNDYDIDLYTYNQKINTADCSTNGSVSLTGNISQKYTKDGFDAYEIADDSFFSVIYTYNNKLLNESSEEWHLTEDSGSKVNGVELDNNIKRGAVILQTSLDRNKWVFNQGYTDVISNSCFNKDSGINSIQLSNGCWYRLIIAYETEKIETGSFDIWDLTSTKLKSSNYKRYAEEYIFYASYKNTNTDPTGKKILFYAGAKNSENTVKTKTNNYDGSETITIDNKDPHYGWNLGYFCLSGYTDKGDTDDVYLKKVGNRVKLTFRLEQDINNLNGNSNLIIESDKDGSDQKFGIKNHNMKHGELVIRHIDDENKHTEVNYSNYLEALASTGADTSIQLFEEGKYEVHLDYAITDKGNINKFDNTTYYQTSFKFMICNGNCMVYMFDSKSGTELSNCDTTENGFRIATANSKYININMKREILNSSNNGLTPRFNGVVSNGEEFTDEGIYTIYANNPNVEKVKDFEATIYVGNNPILKAYTKHLNTLEQYTIAELNNNIRNGWTITDSGDLIEPVVETTTITTASPETTTTTTEITTIITSAEAIAAEAPAAPDSSVPKEETTNKSALPIVGGGVGVVTLGGVLMAALKKKR